MGLLMVQVKNQEHNPQANRLLSNNVIRDSRTNIHILINTTDPINASLFIK